MTKLRRTCSISLKPTKLLFLPTMAALLAFGMYSGLTASSSKAAGSCTLYASTSGSDSNDGSASHPFATAQKLASSLAAGQTGCLAAGQTFNGAVSLYDHGGSPGAPITITSSDPANPATIFGRVVTHPGADYFTFSHLNFNWDSGGQNFPSITIGSAHISLTYDDIQNQNTAICINAINDPTWGTANYTLIDHNRIHNCGVRPVTSYSSSGYFAHGIYVIGNNTTITNNYIYDNSNRGIQLRGSQNAVVEHNTIDGNGSGVIFGDLAANNNEVAYNIITNSANACNGGCNSYGAYSWWGTTATGAGNTFHDNCVYGNQAGDINTTDNGYTATNNKTVDPQYTDRTNHNYTLKQTSPCQGYGADGTFNAAAAVTTTTTTTAAPPPTTTTTSAPPSSPPPASAPVGTLPLSTAEPAISGQATVGGTLNATSGSWTGTAPIAYTYQWQRCATAGSCTQIDGANSAAYKPTSADVGQALTVSVSASNVAGTAYALSAPTGSVTGPYAVTQTIVDGSSVSGSILWHATPTGSAAHVDFLVDGNLQTTEKFAPYGAPCDTCMFDTTKLTSGSHVFSVKAYSLAGAVAVASSTVTVANTPPPASLTAPSISGDPRVGVKLASTNGTWSEGDSLSYSYNWLRCNRSGGGCVQIDGANDATYVVSNQDRGSTLRIMVTTQNPLGSASSTSNPTGVVKH